MIHTIYTMTLRQYARLDKENDLSLLKRWYNPLPIKWFDTEPFFISVREVLGDNTNRTNHKDAYNLLSWNRIQMLDQMLKMIGILMESQNTSTIFTTLLGIKPVFQKSNMPFYVAKVKSMTGIKIKDGHDLKTLQKEIQRRIDKYKENNKTPKQVIKHEFIDIVENVFEIQGKSMNMGLTIYEFGAEKRNADRKIRKAQADGTK